MRKISIIAAFIIAGNYCTAQTIKQTQVSAKPITLGTAYEFKSAILGENRTLNFYLPEGYSSTDSTKYAVIYLLDGGIDEDFIHVSGLVQFNTFEWVNRMPKSIVVGIANNDRKKDFTFPTAIRAYKDIIPSSGGSAKFISFIENEVQPFVRATVNTTGERTLIGESLGGLLATEILFTKPHLFNKYIIISPSLWWDNGSLLSRSTQEIGQLKQRTDVYIGVGKEGLTPGNTPRVMEVDANLLKDKLDSCSNKHLHTYFDYLPDENHATIGHHALFNAFRGIYSTGKK
ncbi:MAG: alpha/beta hydrolase-fold protein [Bacteroidota bacterium]